MHVFYLIPHTLPSETFFLLLFNFYFAAVNMIVNKYLQLLRYNFLKNI